MKRAFTFLVLAVFMGPDLALAELCDHTKKYCGLSSGATSSAGGAPTRGSKIRINPSAVPLEKGLGLEFIYFDQSLDFALVQGLGRVGAAISPSNSEETFFGPPAIEITDAFLERKVGKHKLPAQKYTLATAVGLITNKRSGLKRAELNLGIMGKYNTITKSVLPGGGLSGVLGPFTFGYSAYKDQTLLDYAPYALDLKQTVDAHVETYSIGAFFNSIAIDYSSLKEVITDQPAIITVVTGTLLLKRSLLTVSFRTEKSDRPAFDFETQELKVQENKQETFFGAQFIMGNNLMLGAFYNYYLMREVSFGATVFF
ncbi:MAG: hypothetical protein J0L82_12175 [Deltaproteobacteria bacterium]|jgi:hypothetical protein|nr:hypothetical protein [Deltaproteobacteria bacterium]